MKANRYRLPWEQGEKSQHRKKFLDRERSLYVALQRMPDPRCRRALAGLVQQNVRLFQR